MKKRRKNKRKLKAITTISILLFAIFLFLGNTTVHADKEKEVIYYTVSQGETLWSIAKQYTDKKTDIRQYIYEIEQLNNMETATIYAGQTIQLYKQ